MTTRRSAERRATADADREEKLRALHDQLAQQVAALRSGDDWQRWLAAAARFHNYSFGNTLLILAQRPDATAVAGYQTWKSLGRQVNKGEKGIAILAPVIRRAAPADQPDRQQPDTGSPLERSEPGPGERRVGEGTTGETQRGRKVSGFRPTYVFDVAQTTGDPLPEPPAPQLLTGQAPPGLWDALAAQVAAAGYSLERGPCDDANGVTIPAARTVRVRDDVDDAQAVKTLAHELAHVLLHTHRSHDPAQTTGDDAPATTSTGDDLQVSCRGRAEVEAESVAYLVTATYGLDSSTYTFPYVINWAAGIPGQAPHDVVRATGDRVLATARDITAAVTPVTASLPGTLTGMTRPADLDRQRLRTPMPTTVTAPGTGPTRPDVLLRTAQDLAVLPARTPVGPSRACPAAVGPTPMRSG